MSVSLSLCLSMSCQSVSLCRFSTPESPVFTAFDSAGWPRATVRRTVHSVVSAQLLGVGPARRGCVCRRRKRCGRRRRRRRWRWGRGGPWRRRWRRRRCSRCRCRRCRCRCRRSGRWGRPCRNRRRCRLCRCAALSSCPPLVRFSLFLFPFPVRLFPDPSSACRRHAFLRPFDAFGPTDNAAVLVGAQVLKGHTADAMTCAWNPNVDLLASGYVPCP